MIALATLNLRILPATLAQTVAPGWFVLPVALLALLVTATHVLTVAKSTDMPLSRRRLRTATGYLLLVTIPAVAYAFGIADTTDQRRFVLAWTISAGLVALVLCMALLDLLNNIRIARRDMRDLRRGFAGVERSAAGKNPRSPGNP